MRLELLNIKDYIFRCYSSQEDVVNEEVSSEGPDLVKNTNAADVHAAARERREQAKLEAQKKKDKDKEDR